MFRKVRVSIVDYKKLPTTTLDRSVPLYGTRKPNQVLGFTFKPPDTRRRDSAGQFHLYSSVTLLLLLIAHTKFSDDWMIAPTVWMPRF